MLDFANIVFKNRNLVIKEAEPSDICKEKIIKCKLQRSTAVSGGYFYCPKYKL